MYYSNGNYEAFADAKKPAGVDKKSAYIIGSGLAGLSAAVFLVRDAQMKGENIHILEELPVAGGSLDGAKRPNAGFVVRGGREMENHFECLWDMYRSIPSLEIPGASYLDEYYWLDKEDPNSSNCRLIYNRGDRLPSDGQYGLGKCANEIVKLIMTPEKELQGETIEEFFSDDFFKTNFWTYWATMFAFEKWHSAAEMRRYAMRFIHHIDGLPDFTALKFNKYNQYESMVKPLLAYLKDHGVDITFTHPGVVKTKLFNTNKTSITSKIYNFFANIFLSIFMKSDKAALCFLKAIDSDNKDLNKWIGPRGFLHVWGYPNIQKLRKSVFKEKEKIVINKSDEVIQQIKDNKIL